MKKIILQLLVVSATLFTCNNLQAQFTLTGYTTENTFPDTTDDIEFYVTVENHNLTDSIFLRAFRTIQYLVPGHEESFCFGINCFPSGTDSSTDPCVIPPDTLDRTFHITVLPHGVCGTSYIRYRIVNLNNSADFQETDMSFGFCTAAGMHELTSSFGVSRPTLNPADGYTSFNYRLNENNGQSRIEIYNMLGARVRTIHLLGKMGESVMTTSDLKPGLYLCSIVSSDNNVTNTYKLVVAHK